MVKIIYIFTHRNDSKPLQVLHICHETATR